MPRRFVIFQFPNGPMIVAMAAAALTRQAGEPAASYAAVLSRGALAVWAYQEVVSGANWFRRLLGVVAGAYSVAQLRRLSLQRPAAA